MVSPCAADAETSAALQLAFGAALERTRSAHVPYPGSPGHTLPLEPPLLARGWSSGEVGASLHEWADTLPPRLARLQLEKCRNQATRLLIIILHLCFCNNRVDYYHKNFGSICNNRQIIDK